MAPGPYVAVGSGRMGDAEYVHDVNVALHHMTFQGLLSGRQCMRNIMYNDMSHGLTTIGVDSVDACKPRPGSKESL